MEDGEKPFVIWGTYRSTIADDRTSEFEVAHINIVNSNSNKHNSDGEGSTVGIFVYLHLPSQLLSCSMRNFAIKPIERQSKSNTRFI